MNRAIVDEENTEIFMSDTDVFYSDEMQEDFSDNDVKDDSDDLGEKDFENDYYSGPETKLLDGIDDVEEKDGLTEDEEENDEESSDKDFSKKALRKKASARLIPYMLLDELLQPENYRIVRKFLYRGEKYKCYVVAQLSTNRFVFNVLPDNVLKAINIDEIKLI